MRERLRRPDLVESHTATTLLADFTMARSPATLERSGWSPQFDIESVYSEEKYVRMHLSSAPSAAGRPQKQRLACFPILRRIHMPQQIVESSVFRSRAEIEILDSVANAVSRVGRSMSIAGIRRRLRHLDTKVPEPYGKLRERVGCRAAVTSSHTMRERDPRSSGWEAERVDSGPVLNDVFCRVRFCPGDPESIDKFLSREVEDHPLRMECVLFAFVVADQVGIALPVSALVSIRHPREADVAGAVIARDSAVRQRIAERVADKASRCGRAL
jgi:hypothetical protein